MEKKAFVFIRTQEGKASTALGKCAERKKKDRAGETKEGFSPRGGKTLWELEDPIP